MKKSDKKPQLIKDFGLLLKAKPTTGEMQEDIKEEERRGYMDPANICMIVPLKKWVKEAITSLYDAGEESKIPSLDYKHQERGLENTSKYSMEYLSIMLKLSNYYDSIELSLMHEYPLRVKTEDFIIILAPRVSNE